MMSATSSSVYSSCDSCYSVDFDWTDTSPMTTPSKARANGLSNQKRDNMIPALRADIQDAVYKNCTLEHFIQHIWGVSPSTIEKLLSAEWTLDATAFSRYNYILDPSNTLREPDLHVPFRSIASKLVQGAHIFLGNSNAPLVEQFWDGNGSTIISSKYTKRKPDLLSLWGSVPEWSKTRIPVEFKIDPIFNVTGSSVSLLPITEDPISSKSRGSPPPSSSRQPQHISPSTAAQYRRSKKKKAAHSRSRTGTISCSRGTLTSTDADPSRLENDSIITSGTSLKRPRSAEDDDLASIASVNKRSRYAANYLTQHQLQLATYALECLSVSSRQYATGILINSRQVTLLYFDRTAVIRTVPFDFGKDSGPARLALVLYALSQCEIHRAGFLPYLRRIRLPEDDAIVPESAIQPLKEPPSDLTETCLVFPDPCNPTSKRFFHLRNLIYTYRGLVGRGSMVYETIDGLLGKKLPKEISILKLSWQYLFCRHEGEIISHLRNAIPAWKDHIPELCFSATFSAEELDLPWVRMELEDFGTHIKLRRLDVMASRKYQNLWKAGSIEEFKQAFIDCVECHYHAYTTGRVLHRDLSDNNLMLWHPELVCPSEDLASSCSTDTDPLANSISMPGDTRTQPSVLGILNDWDMASELTKDGEVPNSAALHRTGTLPFMATDLLATPPPPHYYRHDLESFFYILIWAAVHYDLEKKTRRPTSKLLALWGDQNQAAISKHAMFGPGRLGNASREAIWKLTGQEFQEIHVQWILPLHNLFMRGLQSVPEPHDPEFATYDHVTCDGRITFETFMAAMGIKPRSLESAKASIGGE